MHDGLVKLLAPYGRFTSMDLPEGWTTMPRDVAPVVDDYRSQLGMTMVSLAVDGPGLAGQDVVEQLTWVAEEVAPRLGVTMG